MHRQCYNTFIFLRYSFKFFPFFYIKWCYKNILIHLSFSVVTSIFKRNSWNIRNLVKNIWIRLSLKAIFTFCFKNFYPTTSPKWRMKVIVSYFFIFAIWYMLFVFCAALIISKAKHLFYVLFSYLSFLFFLFSFLSFSFPSFRPSFRETPGNIFYP